MSIIKRFLFSLLFFSAAVDSHAQNFQMGLKGGLSLPDLSSGAGASDVSKGYQTISGPDFAWVTDMKLAGKFSLEAAVEWSTQGGKKTGIQTIPASEFAQFFPPGSNIQYVYANFTSTVRLQYLMLPVLLRYDMDLDIAGHWKLYMEGGIFGGYMLTGKGSASGSSKVYKDKEETNPISSAVVTFDSVGDIRHQLHRGNFGIDGNIGIQYQLNSMAIFAEGGGNYGFINLQKNSENGINHTGSLIFRIGFFIRMRKPKVDKVK
jgi:hypothetical protein